jgi:hypothetical protein
VLYHASKIAGIKVLTPHISNHGKPLLYLSTKRENVLVYLSNAIEKHCKQVGFHHEGMYRKWGSYGFTQEGVLCLQEYYPNATVDTYQNEPGYIYRVEHLEQYENLPDIPQAVMTEYNAEITDCEYVPDAYEEIMKAVETGQIVLQRFKDNSQAMLDWIEKTIKAEYNNAGEHPEYREFLQAKFNFCPRL